MNKRINRNDGEFNAKLKRKRERERKREKEREEGRAVVQQYDAMEVKIRYYVSERD